MANYKALGIVCASYKLGEADRIVHLYTDQGMVRAVAKGVRKTKSKFGGRLEPLTYVDLVLYKGKNLDTICQVQLIEHFKSIRNDFRRLSYGLVITDFINRTFEHESHPGELFKDCVSALKSLNDEADEDLVLLSFIGNSLAKLGYAIDFENCFRCGANIVGGSHFSPKNGGVFCPKCYDIDDWSMQISSNVVKSAKGLTSGQNQILESVKEDDKKLLMKIFRSFIDYHMDINLRSYRFIDRIADYPDVGR